MVKKPKAADDGKPKKQVRYKVLKQCFVNGSICEPGTRTKPRYVTADAGLEGEALELADGGSVPPVGKLDDGGKPNGDDTATGSGGSD